MGISANSPTVRCGLLVVVAALASACPKQTVPGRVVRGDTAQAEPCFDQLATALLAEGNRSGLRLDDGSIPGMDFYGSPSQNGEPSLFGAPIAFYVGHGDPDEFHTADSPMHLIDVRADPDKTKLR